MGPEEKATLDQLNAYNWAALYRCRWSAADAEVVVPKLVLLLSSSNTDAVNEALRALFRIGTPAEEAAEPVKRLVGSTQATTRKLAVLTLGQIAHHKPATCVGTLTDALANDDCCRDAMRILAFIGPAAGNSLDAVLSLFADRDAKVRKAVIKTAVAIGGQSEKVAKLLSAASEDLSKLVREAALRALDEIA